MWPVAKKLSCKRIVFYSVYKNADTAINFENQVTSPQALGQHLVAGAMEIDGKLIRNSEILQRYDDEITQLTRKQTDFVNSEPDREKIKYAADISYYSLKPIFDLVSKPWKNETVVEKNFQTFGNKFLTELNKTQAFSREYFHIICDPRNDLLGKEALEAI